MHVWCYGNVTELCAMGLKSVFSLFGDITFTCVVLKEITVATEMATSDYVYFPHAIARNAV